MRLKSDVYDNLGAIDEQVSMVEPEVAAGFGFGSGAPSISSSSAIWFDESVASDIATEVNKTWFGKVRSKQQ